MSNREPFIIWKRFFQYSLGKIQLNYCEYSLGFEVSQKQLLKAMKIINLHIKVLNELYNLIRIQVSIPRLYFLKYIIVWQ